MPSQPSGHVVGLCNAMSASTGPARAAAIFAGFIAATPECDVWCFVKAAKVDAHALAPGMQVLQHGRPGSPESALVVVARPEVRLTASGLRAGTSRRRGNRRTRIRTRPILVTAADQIPLGLLHSPPPRMPGLRLRYLNRVRRMPRLVKLGDWNIRHAAVSRRHRRASIVSAGVLHVVAPPPFAATLLRRLPGWSLPGRPDHAALVVRLTVRGA